MVDDHPLLYGNNGNLDSSTCDINVLKERDGMSTKPMRATAGNFVFNNRYPSFSSLSGECLDKSILNSSAPIC